MGVSSCFSCKRSFGCHSRLLLPPETPIRSSQNSHNYSNRGAAAAYCYARLLVVRANRAVTVFAMFRFVFLPQPFLAVFAVFVLVVPPDTHTAKHFLSQARVPPFISQTTFHKFHFVCSFSPTLAQPAKKLHYTAKTPPALP